MESGIKDERDESAHKPEGSGLAFMVGFFLSFRILITIFSVRAFGADPQTGSAIKLGLSVLLLGLVYLAWLDSANRELSSVLRLPSIRWVLIFLAFSGCSLLWSEMASPIASAAYWCGTATDVAIVALLLLRGSVAGVAGSLMKGFVWSTCFVAAIAWLMPAQYDLRLGDEDFLNANSIGNLCAFAIFFTQYLTHRKQGKWWPAMAFLAVTLVRSLSKATIVAFVLSESLLVIRDKQISRRAKGFIATGVILVVLVFWGLFAAYYDFYTSYGNEAETLTGRTAIWAYVTDAGLQRPWIGHGFDSMWKVVPTFGTFEARHAENEVLEQFYSYGIAGVVILCGVYGSLYRGIRRLPQNSIKVIFASMVLYVVIRGIAEAEPFDLLLSSWTVVLIGTVVGHADPIGQGTAVISSSVIPLQPAPAASSHMQ